MKKTLVKIYAFLKRAFTKVKIVDSEVYHLPADEFSKLLNEMKYLSDPLGGLIDYVADPDKFFDPNRKSGRDCDDWARQWTIWGHHNGYIAEEYFIYNPKKLFRTAHVITLLWKDGDCYVANYRLFGAFKDEEKAWDFMRTYDCYKDGLEYVLSQRVSPS